MYVIYIRQQGVGKMTDVLDLRHFFDMFFYMCVRLNELPIHNYGTCTDYVLRYAVPMMCCCE